MYQSILVVEMFLELIGVSIYFGIITLVLIIIFIRCPKDKRNALGSFVVLLFLIILNTLLYIPLIAFISLIIIILDIIYFIYIHLPYFNMRSDSDLFFEADDEVWEKLKVNKTIFFEE